MLGHTLYAGPMSAYAELPTKRDSKKEALERASALAGSLGDGIGGGLREASKALAGPEGTDVQGLLASTNLPEIEGEDALRDLAARLDREGDLWRNLAFRELANARWTQKMLQVVAGLVLASAIGLAVLAGVAALFGAGGATALLVGAGAAVLATGTGLFVLVVAFVRRGQRETLREALARADLAELRLHRVAIALAARAATPDAISDVLARLERDARG